MKGFYSRRIILLEFGIAACAIALWFAVFTTSESRYLGARMLEIHQWIDPGSESKAPLVTGMAALTRTDGIPDALENQSINFAYRWPNQLFLSAEVKGDSYHLAREGQEVKIHVPHKKFAIVGANDIPRFSTRPDSVDPVELEPFSLPASRLQLRLLPALVTAKIETSDQNATKISAKFKPWAARKFNLPGDYTFTFSFDQDSQLTELNVKDSDDLNVVAEFSGWQFSGERPLPQYPDDAEKVALSHLVKFVEVTLKNLNSRAEPLPPVTGKRTVLAHSGEGRLEDHDGTKVLFLKGTPEEMGKQHGELLTREIREVTDRILYGIGVGSSFGKGRWFFGEIEEAVSRLHPFTDPRYLAEMDALALASGMDREESRLSNFFPELFHCSGFALNGSATVDGKMYHGRVLDYMMGVGLEQNAVVMVVQPDQGNAWVNLGYAGFIGTVTAMNEKQIAIGEMGGGGEGNWDGKAMAQLMREVMEKANTLQEAISIIENSPRTCEYYYVISDAKSGGSVGIAATPDTFDIIRPGTAHPKLPHPVKDAVLLSSGNRYEELVNRVKNNYGKFNAESARELMTRPVCMKSNIQSVLFAPDTLDFWVANADSENVASHTRYTKYNLRELLNLSPQLTQR
ncbi:MAG: C45 family autoproteolytic acyltransferase/hydrolase [Verrucomicrobiales bacterium]|nr:C45 family autoproteolytic acyltransferase/hydrolase [Verrucomicrobiales bacterium]